MRQSIHIFIKDTRCLRLEICLFAAFAAIFAWAGAHSHIDGPEILLEIAAIYLIARVVHAEAIPGDRQFWLTRPYRWTSLAGAKLLFIATFVCLPICAAQIAMLVAGGFPLLRNIPGLLWSQILIFFVGALVVAAVAALTSGTVLFMLAFLILAAAVSIAEILYPFYIPVIGMYQPPGPSALEWIRQYSVMAVLAVTAALILLWQYRDRATTFSRAAGVGGIVLATASFLWMPSSFLFQVQSWLSRRPAMDQSVQVSIDPSVKGNGAAFAVGRNPFYRKVRIPLPVAVRGVPEGVEARVETMFVSFEWPGKQDWKPEFPPGLNSRSNAPGVSIADGTVLMDPGLYWDNRNSPLTLTGEVYLTLFGDTETRTMTVGARPVNFQDGLQCGVGELNYFGCRSFFRWPGELVYAQSGDTRSTFLDSLVSYSPFPANIGLSTMDGRSGGELKTPELTVITKKPLAHFWKQFRVQGVRLSAFEGPEPPTPRDR